VGGRITNYLLEKSRVVQPAVNERSFHIFYQLIAGSKDSERRQLNLDSADKFQYLRQVWWPCRCTRCCMAAHTRIAGAPVVELLYGGCSQRQRVVQGDRRRYSTSRCIVPANHRLHCCLCTRRLANLSLRRHGGHGNDAGGDLAGLPHCVCCAVAGSGGASRRPREVCVITRCRVQIVVEHC